MDLISVIIPVYNVEEYIRDCLDSVLEQTYSALDIILIDDGSTDRSGEICDQYQALDSRIRVIHQTNQGLSAARNKGMDQMRGQWVIFIDSDDYIHPSMVRMLYETAIEKEVTFVRCAYEETTSGRGDICWHEEGIRSPSLRVVLAAEEVRKYLMDKEKHYVWGAIFHRDLIGQTRFFPSCLYEDIPFTTEITARAGAVCHIDAALCAYRRRPSSITGRAAMEKYLDYIAMLDKENRIIAKELPELASFSHIYFLMKIMLVYEKILRGNEWDRKAETLKRVRDCFRKNASWNILLDPQVPWKNRLFFAACLPAPALACKSRRTVIDFWQIIHGRRKRK